MKKIAVYTIVSDLTSILYPPLIDDESATYYAFTNLKNLSSDFWEIIYLETLAETMEDIKACPRKYLTPFEDYIYVDSKEIIIGKLSEDKSARCSVPDITAYLPKDMDLIPPSKVSFTPNPEYHDGPYNGYPLQLSVCIPISNRIDTIGKCLESLQPLLTALDSELIVVDSSTDGTGEVAKRYGAKVIPFQWTGDFSLARNTAIKAAKGSWILSTDDDQWFEDCSKVIEFFKSMDYLKYDFAVYTCRNYADFSGKVYVDSMFLGLAKNHPSLHYTGIIHEIFDKSFLDQPKINVISSIMHHYGYANNNFSDRKKKVYRNATGLYFTLLDNPLDLRQHYHLATELLILQEYSAATAYCFMLLSLCRLRYSSDKYEASLRKNVTTVLLYTIIHYLSNDKLETQIDNITNWNELNVFQAANIYYLKMHCSHGSNRHEDTINNCKKYLELREEYMNASHKVLLINAVQNDFVSNNIFLNEAYYIQFLAFTALDKQPFSNRLLNKIDFSLLDNSYNNSIVETFYTMPYEKFKKHFSKVDDKIILGLYKYAKAQLPVNELAFKNISEKIRKTGLHKENPFVKLIELYASPDSKSSYQWFIDRPKELNKVIHEIIPEAAKKSYDLFTIIEVLDFENIQASIRALSLFPSEEFIDVLSKYLIHYEDKTELSKEKNSKRVFFICGILEVLVLNRKDYFQLDSENDLNYKNYFLSYISMLVKWAKIFYSESLISGEVSELLPANVRSAFILERALDYKKRSDLNGYSEGLKQAVSICPLYADGIKLLAKDISEIEESKSLNAKEMDEFTKLAIQLKLAVLHQIEIGQFEEAIKTLNQLKALLPDDDEIDMLLTQCFSSSLPS